MRPIVVYGNCQAERIVTVLGWLPAITERFRIVYYSSFERPPGTEIAEATPQDLAECALFVGHPNDPARPIDRGTLPADCAVVTFPPLDFNALWPFTIHNLYDAPEPGRPWGAFPYGDRIVSACLEEGRNAQEALDYCLTGWDSYKPNLERLFHIETLRLRARDAQCDIKMGEYVLGRFREQNLFWTRNHPTGLVMRELAVRVIAACSVLVPVLANIQPQHLEPYTPPEWPFGAMQVPIHPKVAEFFGLQWYNAAQRYRMYETEYTYAEYFAELIRHAVALRAADFTKSAP